MWAIVMFMTVSQNIARYECLQQTYAMQFAAQRNVTLEGGGAFKTTVHLTFMSCARSPLHMSSVSSTFFDAVAPST